MNPCPQVTFNSGMTEAPDETAQGEWLNLVSKAGFSFLMAHVKYLRDGEYKVERIEEEATRDAVSMTMLRVRPVRPGRRAATPPRRAYGQRSGAVDDWRGERRMLDATWIVGAGLSSLGASLRLRTPRMPRSTAW